MQKPERLMICRVLRHRFAEIKHTLWTLADLPQMFRPSGKMVSLFSWLSWGVQFAD